MFDPQRISGRNRERILPASGLLALGGLAIVAWLAMAAPVAAQASGCRPELGSEVAARVAVQPLAAGPDGGLTSAGEAATDLELRSGQAFRLLVRPREGSARPSGAECPVRLNIGRLTPVARSQGSAGFFFDGSRAYALLRPDEERPLDFVMKPFEEWSSIPSRVEIEGATIRFPETAEFVGRLPAPSTPPAGSVCADVIAPDGGPVEGVALGLSASTDAPSDLRASGPDGRVCWDGFDEMLYGDLSLEQGVDTALGQPRSQYVSYETSYRLFIVKRPS